MTGVDYDSEFVRLETQQLVDRYKSLDDKNRSLTNSFIRFFTLLVLYAAAPFSLPMHWQTGFIRVWSFGGFWLAIVAWMHFDRGLRAYGRHLFERVHCVRHLAYIRKLIYKDSTSYKLHSILPIKSGDLIKPRCGDPTHISSSQITATIYFYKVVGLFAPLYLVLFMALILLPKEMLDPTVMTTRLSYLRFILGFSAIFFIWLLSSSKNCFSMQEEAFRARRITTATPWPIFPQLQEIMPTYARVKRVLFLLYGVAIAGLSIMNAVRLAIVLSHPWVDGGWTTFDKHLAYITCAVLCCSVVFVEIEARVILWRARATWSRVKDWLA